jgi:acid phosphatase (class A)
MNRQRLFGLLLAAGLAVSGFAQEQLHYLSGRRPDPATLLPPPAPAGSGEQAAELTAVRAIHDARATNELELAFGEKKFTVFNFKPAVGAFFTPERLPKTEAFFQHVLKDAAFVADAGKDFFKRPRPYTVEPSLAVGKLEKSFSYPSGHSTEGMTLALVLADLLPEKRAEILAIGRDLGWHRVWIGRHYPSDIYAGRVLAQAIVREFKASEAFRNDLAAVRTELTAVMKYRGATE